MKEKFRMKNKMTMVEFLERYFDMEFLMYQKIILNREVKNESRRNCITPGNSADVK